MNILFVCTGNTCRSPLAEAMGQAEALAGGLSDVSCASAGTAAFPGQPAAGPGLAVAAEHGLDLRSHTSRGLSPELLEWADLIIAMEASHAAAVSRWDPTAPVRVITDFLPARHDRAGGGVPDPYGGDLETYQRSWRLLALAMRGLFEALRTDGTGIV